ncbi:exodeoxyribonuclease VII small subunit [Gammaproteobacteria bacterium]|jgi:exodeoxyribonuclease VII small subunit|nr:exodeoxyribonuclease VII small subunit [Gammaproteobacteria bacterium]MDA9112056.1 exodeoxyribonuclease VII small subunit [Gammaproteobacteria bacterium]MDB4252947.1 exodeoxyribonuclease VII small subunit [Gammaproteobacteria bacterium]MDB9997531.1 exodeoxyribonuclease VII small subunit [Gammaproteobacteria bacterium]|tara:strand:+ start:4640 stop:4864 length:225 start_codon:yes stop_codon:yes gene_type:complete
MGNTKDQIDFEASLKKLESIVAKLENNDINLEDSVQSFEEGIKLVKECQKQLSDAELKVKKLLENGSIADLEDK